MTDPVSEAKTYGDTASIDLWYPRVDGAVQHIEVGLVDVRAADSIRITYDFERDGYSIQQASRFAFICGDPTCDPDWQEVAFVEAWARQETDEAQEARLSQGDRETLTPDQARQYPLAPE